MNPRATIRDVARVASVSHTTASLALPNDERISEATRKKVAQAAAPLGYKQHAAVSDLMAQLRFFQRA
jgi:LacI family transcriptional regulator